MKKALLLAVAGLFAAIAPALAYPPPAANVNFSSERGVPFGLVLDGRPLTRGAARQVHVDRLAPGLHWAEFTVPAAYGRVVRFRSRVWLEPGLETTFVLIARPGRPLGLRQVATVALYGPNRGQGNRNGYNGGSYNNRPTPYDQGGNGSYPYDAGNANSGYDNPRQSAPGYENTPSNGGYYPGSAGNGSRTMTSQDVDALVQAVQQRSFEASKLSIAKEALAQSSIQADDLKRLLRSLEFEASRVELAKFAYPRVADPQNFYRVYEAFQYDDSIRDVQQAVRAGQ
ncbi:DUF4476 domain-containing protein [Hymenobacter sp. BT683]|uniref:DUF4476 domain-containing protein n=1 Tax=Hymenobacter jeongseonensis TaxID=2791027 RepID=A0ABS0IDH5_9BACT|nr:DUF4476 domain-containing protein [Hymenobacter jeongseonensis]MBF9236018.1 DUF4476 domain-containing protein [Hymenobacter jeongseonensis]